MNPTAIDCTESNRDQARNRYVNPLDRPESGLESDPAQWRGRRIRSRKAGAVYTVRQVYRSGRVELEKSWMGYASDVKTIRDEYETYT
jgi:hypothetical protein